MRMVPAGEAGDAWRRLRREHAQREAETLVPRPGHPIYGVAAPSLTPAVVAETLRRAMLGAAVPSEPAQEAWSRHWSAHTGRLSNDPGSADFLAEIADREARTAAILPAWAEWAETA